MWNEISFSAWIHHVLHALAWYSIIIVHQPSNVSYVSAQKYKLYLLLHCLVSHSRPQTHPRICYLFSVIFLNEIFIVLCMLIFMHEQKRETGKQTLKDKNSSFKFYWLLSQCISILQMQVVSVLLSFSLPLTLQCQLQTLRAAIQHPKKKKLKPRCRVYFHSEKHDRWKIDGERKHSRQRRQLWNLGEPTATNLCFTGAQWCTVGSWDDALMFPEEREGANERKWQQMKLAGCGVLFPPAHSNEQAVGTDWGNWSPVGPEPSLSHLSGVFSTLENTHTCGGARMEIVCTYWHAVRQANVKTRHRFSQNTSSPSMPLCVLGIPSIASSHSVTLSLYSSLVAATDGDRWWYTKVTIRASVQT